MMVSVAMTTFRQEALIEEAILGVLMQECDFEVELIIADDCSPDNTEMVVNELINKHPNGHWINYTRHKENIGIAANWAWSLLSGKGEYLAICEGDDYWTDPKKLQKQVDFLADNLNYSMCCHSTNEVDKNGIIFKVASCSKEIVSLPMVLEEGWFIRSASIVFRSNVLSDGFPTFFYSAYSTDYILQVMILKKGSCKYFSEIMSSYRHHDQGVSKVSKEIQLNRWLDKIKLLKELDDYTDQKYYKEISKQKKEIKRNISFSLLRHPGLLKTLGIGFYLENFNLAFATKPILRRLKK